MKKIKVLFYSMFGSFALCVMFVLACVAGFFMMGKDKYISAEIVYAAPANQVYRVSDVRLSGKVDDLSNYKLQQIRNREHTPAT